MKNFVCLLAPSVTVSPTASSFGASQSAAHTPPAPTDLQSDNPGKAGGLMSGAASKAVALLVTPFSVLEQ